MKGWILVPIHVLTDSVAPAAIPCRIRQAMCVLYDWLTPAPTTEPRRRMVQPRRIGRRPNTMDNGRIRKAPAGLLVGDEMEERRVIGRGLPKAMTKLGYVVNFTISSGSFPSGLYSWIQNGKIGPAPPTNTREKMEYQQHATRIPHFRHLCMLRGSLGSEDGTGMRRTLPSESSRVTLPLASVSEGGAFMSSRRSTST
jgi:hypothetical protein